MNTVGSSTVSDM